MRSLIPYAIVLFVLTQFSSTTMGQGFDLAGVLGVNASQIDGDELAGFNKIGLHGGLRINYQTRSKLNGAIELLYSQRGSRSELSIGSPSDIRGISLHYLEIPLLFSIHDWYDETKNYHRVRGELGISYAYLFDVNSNNTAFDNSTDQFRNSDLSYMFGAAYQFNPNWAVALRYTRSFIKIYNDPIKQIDSLLSYFITLRLEYHF